VSEFESIADRLDAIVADLDEVAFDRLREAMADGATTRPQADKTITQARRAVEKAAHLLRSLD
jgi:exonuclease VII small subunit